MQIDRTLVVRAVEALEGNCSFFACPGPSLFPVAMATCGTCEAVALLRNELADHDKRISTRVIFNRWNANVVEHYTDDDKMFPQPVCGQRLSTERANFADRPTGLATVCLRCEKKKRKEELDKYPVAA